MLSLSLTKQVAGQSGWWTFLGWKCIKHCHLCRRRAFYLNSSFLSSFAIQNNNGVVFSPSQVIRIPCFPPKTNKVPSLHLSPLSFASGGSQPFHANLKLTPVPNPSRNEWTSKPLDERLGPMQIRARSLFLSRVVQQIIPPYFGQRITTCGYPIGLSSTHVTRLDPVIIIIFPISLNSPLIIFNFNSAVFVMKIFS